MSEQQIPQGPPPPQEVIPTVRLIYRTTGGMRQVVAVEIGGNRMGGVARVHTGIDMTNPVNPQVPRNGVYLELAVLWPFQWVEEGASDLLVARAIPPGMRQ